MGNCNTIVALTQPIIAYYKNIRLLLDALSAVNVSRHRHRHNIDCLFMTQCKAVLEIISIDHVRCSGQWMAEIASAVLASGSHGQSG